MKIINFNVIIVLVMFLFIQPMFGQSPKNPTKTTSKSIPTSSIVEGLSDVALNDLLNVCALNCEKGNDVLNSFALYKLNAKWGGTHKDAAHRFLIAKNNTWMLDRIFILFYGDYDWMQRNFIELGVKPVNSKILTDFLIKNIDEIKERESKN